MSATHDDEKNPSITNVEVEIMNSINTIAQRNRIESYEFLASLELKKDKLGHHTIPEVRFDFHEALPTQAVKKVLEIVKGRKGDWGKEGEWEEMHTVRADSSFELLERLNRARGVADGIAGPLPTFTEELSQNRKPGPRLPGG